MPEMSPQQRAQGGWVASPPAAVPVDDLSPLEQLQLRTLPVPDQSRYGPPGTTDSPRFRADGVTPWPRTKPEGGA